MLFRSAFPRRDHRHHAVVEVDLDLDVARPGLGVDDEGPADTLGERSRQQRLHSVARLGRLRIETRAALEGDLKVEMPDRGDHQVTVGRLVARPLAHLDQEGDLAGERGRRTELDEVEPVLLGMAKDLLGPPARLRVVVPGERVVTSLTGCGEVGVDVLVRADLGGGLTAPCGGVGCIA